jgi:serine protease AprX
LLRELIEAEIDNVVALREPDYALLSDQVARHGATVLEAFWITRALLVEMPIGEISRLAELPELLAIEASQTEDPPPSVAQGRDRIGSDPYFNAGYGAAGFIGLLDTGVFAGHTHFAGSPSPLRAVRDCNDACAHTCSLSATPVCPGPCCGGDDCWDHGTSSAAIMVSKATQQIYRGVTSARLDSWKVYPNQCGGLSTSAVLRAFQAAIAAGNHVIVAEMQSGQSWSGSISSAANSAFDAGRIVIAANGNFGPGAGTVRAPANAHKVIGVGAYNVGTLDTYISQSRGPTSDGRIKPDFQMPTDTVTASNAHSTALRTFCCTSGATPYAGGMALLWRNFLEAQFWVAPAPGQVYAHLIMSGPETFPSFNNIIGVGRAAMPNINGYFNGWYYNGKVTVSHGQVIDVPLYYQSNWAPAYDLRAALWWPGDVGVAHNNIDLYLVDSAGVVRASSTSGPSVFERASVAGSVGPPATPWKVRIVGTSVPTGSQDVYWAAHKSFEP